MAFINAKGIDIYYELYGEGPPLVLIAGYTGDHSFWRLMQEELAKHFQVCVFDNRAIGQTRDAGIPFSLETMAEDTIALVTQLGLEKPHILGQSMGGAIAQIIARKYPGLIDKLVILNSVAKFNMRSEKVLASLLSLRKAELDFDLFIDTALPWFFTSEYLAQAENIQLFKKALLDNPFPQTVIDQERQFNALLPFDSRAWIHDISSPTLVIAAKDDLIALPAESKALAQGISKSHYVLTPGAHSSPVEQAEQMNQAIISFLV